MHIASLSRLTTAALSLGLVASVAVAPADAAKRTTTTQVKAPAITKFGPATLGIGDVLTIRGTRLKAGKVRTRVAFQRRGGRAVFAKATKTSATRLQVVVPEALRAQLPVVGGVVKPARFRLRVLTTRFGKAFTADAASPMIGPAAANAAAPAPSVAPAVAPTATPLAPTSTSTQPTLTAPAPTPDPGPTTPVDPTVPTPPVCVTNPADGDTDGDLLTNAEELRFKTDPCAKDTDGDTVTDYFEQRSALDLNSVALPYPGSRPYPNPLDGTDAGTDFDGDGLTLEEEQLAWRTSGSPRTLTYSDGTQYTGGRHVVGTVPGTDIDGNGVLSDDERDLDGDGLTNWDEQHGRATPGWWIAAFKDETPYVGRTFEALDFTKADTDGDGVKDGADDEDHDGFTNLQELQRPRLWEDTYVSTDHAGTDTRARVNPFNPCKPFFSSKCHVHPPFGAYPDTEDWASPVHEDGP